MNISDNLSFAMSLAILLFFIMAILIVASSQNSYNSEPIYHTYQLSNGQIIECADTRGSLNSNYFSDCKDNLTYIQQINVVRLK